MEYDKEELEGAVLGDGGDEFSIVPFVYPCGMVSVSSLGYFSSVGSSSTPSHLSLPVIIRAHHIQEYFKKKRGGKQNSSSHSRRRPGTRSGLSQIR